MSEIDEIIEMLVQFRNERDWGQFHNGKDLAMALNIESGELLELFLWKEAQQVNIEKLKDEIADVLVYAFFLSREYNLNVKEIIYEKMRKNALKYPVDKAKGNMKKYTEL